MFFTITFYFLFKDDLFGYYKCDIHSYLLYLYIWLSLIQFSLLISPAPPPTVFTLISLYDCDLSHLITIFFLQFDFICSFLIPFVLISILETPGSFYLTLLHLHLPRLLSHYYPFDSVIHGSIDMDVSILTKGIETKILNPSV